MSRDKLEPRDHPLAQTLYEIIFEADTFGGKVFDLGLLLAIMASVTAVSLETVAPVQKQYGYVLRTIEWTCTILFTIEYLVRVACVKQPRAYIFSFFGIVDLVSFLPAYIGLATERSTTSFAVIRALRLLRVFRIMELSWLESEAGSLRKAIWDARAKVVVFFMTVLIIVTIAGAAMYEIEGKFATPQSPSEFDSIPQAVYWAIITMTTVGYGDVVPHSILGKFVAALLVLLGYSLIIVPTGFVSAELSGRKQQGSGPECPGCTKETHDVNARFCNHCGAQLVARRT